MSNAPHRADTDICPACGGAKKQDRSLCPQCLSLSIEAEFAGAKAARATKMRARRSPLITLVTLVVGTFAPCVLIVLLFVWGWPLFTFLPAMTCILAALLAINRRVARHIRIAAAGHVVACLMLLSFAAVWVGVTYAPPYVAGWGWLTVPSDMVFNTVRWHITVRSVSPLWTMIILAIAYAPLYLFFHLRPPRRRMAWECRTCGYPLFGLSEPRCPECGTVFDPTGIPRAERKQPLDD